MHRIEWIEQPKQPESRVTTIHGKVNGILAFEISQFSQTRIDENGKEFIYKDPYILTSKIFPMEMEVDANFMNIKVKAHGVYRQFLEKII
jgi:hypothetical protein